MMLYQAIEHRMVSADALTTLLNARAKNGWRLHTISPIPDERPGSPWWLLVFER